MQPVWVVLGKDFLQLARDWRAVILLVLMPLAFIVVLGVSLGEDRVRVSVVNQDRGKWSQRVLDDLGETAGIQVELIESFERAERLVRSGRRAAVIVFGPDFSQRVGKCSFLVGGINPFYRDGVDLTALDARILRDETQLMSVSIIEQVAQGTLLRVVLPWMIGQAFREIGKPGFIDQLSRQEELDVALPYRRFLDVMAKDARENPNSKLPFLFRQVFGSLSDQQKNVLSRWMQQLFPLRKVLTTLNGPEKEAMAKAMQDTLQELFPNYDLTADNWAALTRSPNESNRRELADKIGQVIGHGLLRHGAIRYQKIVPSGLVMFAFFLVLIAGWSLVSERKHGTLKRLLVAPVPTAAVLGGKMLAMFFTATVQGIVLLLAGWAIFGMSWGPQPGWLVAVVICTAFSATGLAMTIASVARTETQVAVLGTLLVLLMAALSGALLGDRAMMPEFLEPISRLTPHAWALDAYQHLLLPGDDLGQTTTINMPVVVRSCLVLIAFGVIFLVAAWVALRHIGLAVD